MYLRALLIAALAVPSLALPSAGWGKALPDGAEAMIRAAAAKGDPAVLATIVAVARDANPDSAAEVDALLAGLAQAAAPAVLPPAPPTVVAAAAPPTAAEKARGWTGAVELGGNQLDGANQVIGAFGSLDMVRAEGAWRHRLMAKGDYQETNGSQTANRFSLGYEPRLSLAGARYAYGLVQVEHDTALGFDKRYTLGGGLGIGSVEGAAFRLAMDVGPALRLTEQNGAIQESLSARGSLNLRWVLNQRLTLTQENSLFSDQNSTTAKSQTAIDSQVYGPLKARLSYNVQYERRPGLVQPDASTAARASVVYAF